MIVEVYGLGSVQIIPSESLTTVYFLDQLKNYKYEIGEQEDD